MNKRFPVILLPMLLFNNVVAIEQYCGTSGNLEGDGIND
jgi:hypothetical protein